MCRFASAEQCQLTSRQPILDGGDCRMRINLISSLIGLCIFFNPLKSANVGANEEVTEYTEIKNDVLEKVLKEIEDISKIEYKITLISRRIKPQVSHVIAESVYQHSQDTIDPDLVLAIMSVESWFDPRAKSPAGARGLMQVMPFWRNECGDDLYDIDINIKCGIKIYRKYEKMFKRMDMVLTAYNRGPAAVKRDLRAGKDPRTNYAWSIIWMYRKLKKADFDTIYIAAL